LIVNISASPYHAGKGLEREHMVAQRARDNLACVAFCALVGGQDELVFDGHSFVVDHSGETIARAAQFEEDLLICEVDLESAAAARLTNPRHRSPGDSPAQASDADGAELLATIAPRRRCGRCSSRWRRRSTRRCASGCTTTSRRTVSSTSCSASRAESTARSSHASQSTRSAVSA
jgi:hypothetical protein